MHCNISTLFSKLNRRQVAQCAVRPSVVIELTPRLDYSPRFAQIAEPLQIQALITQLAIEALHEIVVPRFAGRDETRVYTAITQPLHDPAGGELGPGADRAQQPYIRSTPAPTGPSPRQVQP